MNKTVIVLETGLDVFMILLCLATIGLVIKGLTPWCLVLVAIYLPAATYSFIRRLRRLK